MSRSSAFLKMRSFYTTFPRTTHDKSVRINSLHQVICCVCPTIMVMAFQEFWFCSFQFSAREMEHKVSSRVCWSHSIVLARQEKGVVLNGNAELSPEGFSFSHNWIDGGTIQNSQDRHLTSTGRQIEDPALLREGKCIFSSNFYCSLFLCFIFLKDGDFYGWAMYFVHPSWTILEDPLQYQQYIPPHHYSCLHFSPCLSTQSKTWRLSFSFHFVLNSLFWHIGRNYAHLQNCFYFSRHQLTEVTPTTFYPLQVTRLKLHTSVLSDTYSNCSLFVCHNQRNNKCLLWNEMLHISLFPNLLTGFLCRQRITTSINLCHTALHRYLGATEKRWDGKNPHYPGLKDILCTSENPILFKMLLTAAWR